MLNNLLTDIISIIIFTAIPLILLRLVKNRQKRNKLKFLNEVNSDLQIYIDQPMQNTDKIDSFITGHRKKAINFLKDRALNEDAFAEVNDRINELTHQFRIKYMSVLFSGNKDLTNVLDFISADNKITQSELYYLFNEIRNNKTISEAEKDELISNLFKNCVKNNKVVESHTIISSLRLRPFGNLRLILPYLAGLFAILVIVNVFLYNYRYEFGIAKADFTFGGIVFGEFSKYKDYTDRLEEYIKNESGLDVRFEFYDDFGDVEKIWDDITNNKIQGLILNPGMYATIYNNKPDIFNELMEQFLRHQENHKPNYKSAIITLKSNFNKFLRSKNIDVDNFNYKKLNNESRELVRNYLLQGNFTYTHSNSMSGYLLPRIYLWTEFRFNPEERNLAVFSNNHDKSITGVLNGDYWAAAIYDENLFDSYRDRLDDISILYLSPEIPYNSYWIKKDFDSEIKKSIISAFLKLNTNSSTRAINVKANKYNITNWDACNNEQYFKEIESCLEIISAKMPKPKVLFKIDKTDEKYFSTLQDIIEHTKESLDSLGGWIFDTNSVDKSSSSNFVVRIRMFDNVFHRSNPCILEYKISENNVKLKEISLFINEQLQIQPTSYDQRIHVIRKILIDSLTNYISPKPRIYYDKYGLFLNIGRNNGLSNCYLTWEDNSIIPKDIYTIENTRTNFNMKKIKDITQYKDKIVIVKYNLQ